MNLKAKRNAKGTSSNTQPPPTAMQTMDPMTPTISDRAARIKVGRSAPTIFAANQTGAEKTTIKPTCTTMAGSPDILKFIVASPFLGKFRYGMRSV
jgi:hypothetical protein